MFIGEDFGLTPFLEGLVVSSLLLGAAAGASSAGPLSDRLGIRNLILISAFILTVGTIDAALIPSVGVLVLFRVVLGVAVGTLESHGRQEGNKYEIIRSEGGCG